MHFGENELSRNAIGFSPLSTAHPTVLQHRLVRASRRCYPSFTLAMDRSFRFASAACDFSALVRTRFPYGFAYWLNLAAYHNSLAHFPRGTQSGFNALPLACRSMVSGSLSLPFRGSFHRSLAVLCAIGQPGIFSLTRWSGLIPTTFHGGGGTWERIPGRPAGFAYGAFTLYGAVSQLLLLPTGFVTPRGAGSPLRIRPTTPSGLRLPPWHPLGLGYSPFARRY